MKIGTIARSSAGTGAAIAALLAIAPVANADVSPIWSTSCSDPSLSQPFLAWGDSACYALAPGESPDSFSATGWTLSGGAAIITVTLYDGTQGSVLDLPSGGTAVSPVMWVNSPPHPYVRAMVSSANHGAAKTSIAYLGATGFGTSRPTGVLSAPSPTWRLSNHLNLPDNPNGPQQVQLTLVGAGPKTSGHIRIYNLYYQTTSNTSSGTASGDPRMH